MSICTIYLYWEQTKTNGEQILRKPSVNKQQKQELNHNKHLRKQSLLNVSVNLGQNNYLNAFETTHNSSKKTNKQRKKLNRAMRAQKWQQCDRAVKLFWQGKKRKQKCKRRARFIWIPTFRLIFIVFLKLTKANKEKWKQTTVQSCQYGQLNKEKSND